MSGRDEVDEFQGGDRGSAAPREEGRVEALAAGAARLDRADERFEQGALIRYELDSKMTQGDKTLFTFSRAVIWLDTDGTLTNATAVCTADDAHKEKCGELLRSLKIEPPPGARPLDGGA